MEIKKVEKINAVVVLYDPDISIVNNILSYYNYVDKIYLIDNSLKSNETVFLEQKFSEKINYIFNGENLGISKALNIAAESSIKIDKASWLLTMDQDSCFIDGEFKKFIKYLERNKKFNIGLISPYHKTALSIENKNKDVEKVNYTMTSGNIINLNAYNRVGGFNEDYFIDAVDWEYCLRLGVNGYDVIIINTIILNHNLGSPTVKNRKFIGKKIVLNHNEVRRYYITRNKLRIISDYYKAYPKLCIRWFLSIFSDLFTIIAYETNKVLKIKYFLYGIKDFIFKQYGKLK